MITEKEQITIDMYKQEYGIDITVEQARERMKEAKEAYEKLLFEEMIAKKSEGSNIFFICFTVALIFLFIVKCTR